MPRYDELTTTAFHLRPDATRSLDGLYWMLRFPREWIAPISDLMSAQGRSRYVPIAALNRALRSLVPDISAVSRGIGSSGHSGDWLYAITPVPVDGLAPILHAWLCAMVVGDAGRGSQLWGQLPKGDFAWRPLALNETGWPNAAPTIAPDSQAATELIAGLPRSLFHLVPEILTAELLRRSDRPDGFPRGFRRCPTSDGRGVELMTWPPLESTDRRGDVWPFSYRVRLTMQTIPFQPYPVLHVTTGMRRWCRRAPSTGRGRSVSAYLLCSVPWISGLAASRSFRMAPMRWRMIDGSWALQWRSELAYLFDQISFDRPMPDPAILGRDPIPFLTEQGVDDSAAAIVYTTSAGHSHRVGAGVSARDRDRIVTWIADTLNDVITPAPALPRVRMTVAQAPQPTHTEVRERFREAFDKAPLSVEIYWDTQAVRGALVRAITLGLGLELADGAADGDGSVIRWITPELAVTISTRPVGALGSALDPDPTINNPQVRASRAAQPRINMVKESLGQADGPIVSLIELRGREAFPQPGSDPKTALRVGFAATGRLTQFIKPEAGRHGHDDERLIGPQEEEASLSHRAAEAWLDLRRQLTGVIRAPRPRVNDVAIPDPVDTVAIYMIRRNATMQNWGKQQLPIAVWTSSDDPTVWARIPGISEWRPYGEVLLALARRAFSLPDFSQRQTTSFIRTVITSVQSSRPVLLLTWAQNLRFDWRFIQNAEMMIDQTALDGVPIGEAPQMRHVRIRTNDDDEMPQCYGLHDKGVGLPSGLWRLPGSTRVFASTAPKPSSAKSHASPMGSRIGVRLNRNGRAVLDDRKDAWNPQLVEFTVAAIPPGDDPVAWAALAHAQRRIGETFTETLIFPLAFHLARKASEYAIPSLDDDVAIAEEVAIPDLDSGEDLSEAGEQ